MSRKVEQKKEIRQLLLDEMKMGIFLKEDKLPRETVLAEQLGISRTQLRDALADLEREGFISRRHGVGTMINRHVISVKSRMDIETEFRDIIRQNGFEPTIAFLEVSETVADEKVAEKLYILKGAPIICIRLLCNANQKPAIYSEDVLEKRLVKENYKEQDYQFSIFQFLKRFCNVEVHMDLTELHAVVANAELARILQIPEGTALLKMEEVDYDVEGTPIFYSSQYFVEGYFKHTVLRKKF